METAEREMISKFNEARMQLFRLNLSWMKCSQFASSGNLIGWKWELDNIWRELASDAGKGDVEKNLEHNIRVSIAERKGSRQLLYKCLNDKQIWLRSIQENAGKGSSKGHIDEDSFE